VEKFMSSIFLDQASPESAATKGEKTAKKHDSNAELG
jgi:hypothetical protein